MTSTRPARHWPTCLVCYIQRRPAVLNIARQKRNIKGSGRATFIMAFDSSRDTNFMYRCTSLCHLKRDRYVRGTSAAPSYRLILPDPAERTEINRYTASFHHQTCFCCLSETFDVSDHVQAFLFSYFTIVETTNSRRSRDRPGSSRSDAGTRLQIT
jgi:hypothetical protein